MIRPLEDLNPIDVGERLRRAREEANLKQADAAQELGVARTTLIALEQGQRRVRITELQQLAKLYRTSVNAILHRESPQIDLVPRFRKLSEASNPKVGAAVELFGQLVRAEIELENLLGIKRSHDFPPERPVGVGDVVAQAERDAEELRQWLGIGQGPISDVASLLEIHLGARVFIRRFDGKISGMFAFDDATGPCILLNANHPRDRRNQTGAHELGHFVGTRRRPDVLDEKTSERARDERYANAFGRAFMTPAKALTHHFHQIVAGSAQLTRRHVIALAHVFGVSREALVRRLEELGLAKSGTWDWFVHNGGITEEQVRAVIGDSIFADSQKTDADRPLSIRLSILAEQAWRQELLSEGQLARLLNLDRIALREMLDSLNIEESGADESPQLLN
jgi:Zn-dependent peptidase ImmA (M78 family)